MSDRPSRFITARDGLRLHYLDFAGDPSLAPKTPVVCLPGLARSADDFIPLAKRLAAQGRRVLALDYRGRGLSQWDADWRHYALEVEQDDSLAVLADAGVDAAVFFGTSRGGLHIMKLAEKRAAMIRAAVFNDVGPRVELDGLLRIRRYVGKLPPLPSMEDAAALMRLSAGMHFSGVDPQDWATYARQTFVEKDGKVQLRYDPELSHTLDDIENDLAREDFWVGFDALAAVPLLAIRGANSDILSDGTLDDMEARHPGMERLVVPGQGHAPLLLDAPTLEAIDRFFAPLA